MLAVTAGQLVLRIQPAPAGGGVASGPFLMSDTAKYPVCIDDVDCKERHKLKDHACFQYFCYPWKKQTGPQLSLIDA